MPIRGQVQDGVTFIQFLSPPSVLLSLCFAHDRDKKAVVIFPASFAAEMSLSTSMLSQAGRGRVPIKAGHRTTIVSYPSLLRINSKCGMCFPGKRQKALLSDQPEPTKKPSAPAKESPTSVTPSESTTTSTIAKMSAPRVAIVIYSMYGHVVQCESILPMQPRDTS